MVFLTLFLETGFSTAKGSLVRSIMFPKDVGFKFFRDAIRFIAVLAVLGEIKCHNRAINVLVR